MIGVVRAQREFAGSFNRVEAFDTRLKVNQNWTLTGQTMASQTRDLDGTRSGGDAYNIDLHEQDRNYSYDLTYIRNDTGIGGHTEYFQRATLDGGYSWGTRVNYDAPDALHAFRGDGSELQATLTFRPVSRLKLDEIYYLTRLRTRTDSFLGIPLPAVTRPTTVFVNHLVRSRLDYQFTRELSLRLILDYSGVLENPLLIDLERQKRVTGDVLLTCVVHPGTALYIGYTDRLENLGLFPGSPPMVARIGFPSTTTGRQFFAKISYLFRL